MVKRRNGSNRKTATGKVSGFSNGKTKDLSYSSHNCSTEALQKTLAFLEKYGISNKQVTFLGNPYCYGLFLNGAETAIGALTTVSDTFCVHFGDKLSAIIYRLKGFPTVYAQNLSEYDVLLVFTKVLIDYLDLEYHRVDINEQSFVISPIAPETFDALKASKGGVA